MPTQYRAPKILALIGVTVLAATTVLADLASANGGMVQGHNAMQIDEVPAFTFGKPGKASNVSHTIRIKALDMSFDTTAVLVKAGETVRFVVINTSTVDHEFTLGDAKIQSEHREEMAKMDDMAAGHAHDGDSNAVFVKAGETEELVWKFAKAGNIDFACNVPGHYEAGMKGTITIQ